MESRTVRSRIFPAVHIGNSALRLRNYPCCSSESPPNILAERPRFSAVRSSRLIACVGSVPPCGGYEFEHLFKAMVSSFLEPRLLQLSALENLADQGDERHV